MIGHWTQSLLDCRIKFCSYKRKQSRRMWTSDKQLHKEAKQTKQTLITEAGHLQLLITAVSLFWEDWSPQSPSTVRSWHGRSTVGSAASPSIGCSSNSTPRSCNNSCLPVSHCRHTLCLQTPRSESITPTPQVREEFITVQLPVRVH